MSSARSGCRVLIVMPHTTERRCVPSPLKNISSARDSSRAQARSCRAAPQFGSSRRQDLRTASGYRRHPHRQHGCRQHRHAGALAQLSGVEQADAAEQIAIARESNDFLAEAVKKYPQRFAGFASLPIAAPTRRPKSWSAGFDSRASKARSSTATRAAAIWTTSSSGRSWSAPKRSMSRSISTRPSRRRRSSRRRSEDFPHR